MISRLRITLPGGALAGALLFALAAGACSDPTGSGGGPRGIRVVAAPAADSVLAAPQQALVVEVRDSSGKLRPGITVQFASTSVTYPGGFPGPSVFVAGPGGGFTSAVAVATDGSGRAAVYVRMGSVAGEGGVSIAAPTLGFADTVTFAIRPGSPFRLTVSPADSAMYVGRSYALRAGAVDVWGNAAPVQGVSYTVEGTAATLSGSTLSGQALGRVRIRAQAGALEGEAFASVVPQGTLLAARGDGVYMFGLDGSEFRRVVPAGNARAPRWFPDGQRFVYNMGPGHAYLGDLTGASRPLLTDLSGFSAELWPHPSRDGQWVYFGGYDLNGQANPYRVRPDGTGLSRVPGFTPDGFTYGHPTVSPAGDRVIFFWERGSTRDVWLRAQSLTTGEKLFPEIGGHQPEWSHGDSIAFLDMQGDDNGPIRIIASNGTGLRTATFDLSRRYHFGLEWSPDDRWIVARAVQTNRLELVEVATGRTIPLGYTEGLYDAAWRP